MGLSEGGSVQGLEINGPSWSSCLLGDTDHPAAPLTGCVGSHLLNDPQRTVSVQACLDLYLPVGRDRYGFMDGHRFGSLLEKNL